MRRSKVDCIGWPTDEKIVNFNDNGVVTDSRLQFDSRGHWILNMYWVSTVKERAIT